MCSHDNHLNYCLVVTGRTVISNDLSHALNHMIATHSGLRPVCNRLGDVALEYKLRINDLDLPGALKNAFNDQQLDFNIVPRIERKKKLLLADMDSTLIANECIDELASFMGIKDQVSPITAKTMAGELDFIQSFTLRVALLKGLPETVLQEVFDHKIRLNKGAKTLGLTLKKYNVRTVIVSGGFNFFTNRVAETTGFQLSYSNDLVIEDGLLTGLINSPVLGPEEKYSVLESQCRDNNIKLNQTLCVGDGANDIPMINAAGLGVAYHAKPALEKTADVSINHSDLTALLYLQGYNQSEFVHSF